MLAKLTGLPPESRSPRLAEADDAVQKAWLRLSHSGDGDIGNLAWWPTTVTRAVCPNMLCSRRARRKA